jgi:membrane-bound serine protease (ClpP class)
LFQIDSSWFHVDMWVVVVVIICVVAFIAFAVQRSVRAHRYHVSAGREELIGKTAEVKTALDPKGTVFIEGENWTAISEKGRVEPGEEVIVTKVDSLKLWVTKK